MVNYQFIRLFRKLTRNSGLLLRKFDASTHEDARLYKLLLHHEIEYVFDIGANVGQYATSLIDQGFKKIIISFEPMEKEYEILNKMASKYENWQVYERCALGSKETEIEINISKNSVSSSLLPILRSHLESEPDSIYIGSEKIKIYRMDDVLNRLNINPNKLFIKIDVQGFEHEVLEGGKQTIKNCRGVQIEVSMLPLYEGTKYFFEDYLAYFKNLGFELYSLHPAFTDKKTGRVLQCDLIFFKV